MHGDLEVFCREVRKYINIDDLDIKSKKQNFLAFRCNDIIYRIQGWSSLHLFYI